MIIEKFEQRAEKMNSLVCVGLDSDFKELPEEFKNEKNPQFEFNKWIIEQTAQFSASFKFNIAFYEARGQQGIKELKMSMDYLQRERPDIFTICDAKRADIGNTNKGYVTAIFDYLGFDAITLHPYLGKEALIPFLNRTDKGCIILCRTSNHGAGELQDLEVNGKPLWQIVAEKVSGNWNNNNNCMLVVGATYPEEMKRIRELAGEMSFLVPGIGKQGGNVEETIKAGIDKSQKGLIIHSARGIIFAEDPGREAKKLRDEINKYR